jgi:hypothetical protein
MAVVKGSKQLKMMVVPYRPLRSWWVGCAVFGVLVVAVAAAYYVGQQRMLASNGDARAERDALLEEVDSLQAGNRTLQQQVLNLEQAGSVDREALASVQRTIVSLREQISQLEEDVLFYKQIVSPGSEESGLVIGKLDLIGSDAGGKIRFKLELKQQGSNDNLVSGHVNVNVLGMQGGQEVSLPLRSLTGAVSDIDIRLQFRYFQNVEGELDLPEDFEPQKVQILAVAEGPNAKTVQKSFGWLVQN